MFGTADIKTRPLKLAFLVDPNNSKQARAAIRLSSSLWGGAYFPIVSLYKRMPATWRDKPLKAPPAKSTILGLIEGYDPDILVQLSADIPKYISELGLTIIKPEQIWKRLEDEELAPPPYGIGVFELLKDLYNEFFRYKAKYPVKVVLPKIPRDLSLFWASVFGELPLRVLSSVKTHYFEPLEIEECDIDPSKFDELLKGNVFFPRRITSRKLSPQGRGFRRTAAVYFMDASKIEDVIDYWNLRASGREVMPLPKQFKDDPGVRRAVVRFLKAHRRHWRHDRKVCDTASIVRSRNSTMEEMQDFAKGLKIKRSAKDPSSDGFFVLQHWYPRVWDEWARDKDGAVADIYGDDEDSIEIPGTKDQPMRIKSLLPAFADKHGYTGEARCANEIGFRFYGAEEHLAEVFPKSSGENFRRAIAGLTSSLSDWRVGRNGLVKLVQYGFTESRDLPAAEPIFFAWLADLGWQAELSAPGLLGKQIHRKLNGHPGILRNEKLLGLIEHMNGGAVNQDGSPGAQDRINQDRDMPVAEVKSRLEGTSRRRDLHDYLISKGIFKLGLRAQCPHCLRRSWFALEAVTDSLACPKCLNSFPAVGNIDRSKWCYKTTGPFSVPNYAEGAYAALLTLEFFNEHRLSTLRSTPVLSFTAKAPNRKDLEADFALFWRESIYGEEKNGVIFGECKTYGVFSKKDFDRMSYLAKMFPGAVLVFSTLRKSLTAKEISNITRIARAGRKYWKAERPINPILVLTGTELLAHHGPPYCWEDEDKKKHDHVRGLLGLCDATQQRYLKLPSWHTEWHDKWEERRKRRKARMAATQVSTPTVAPIEAVG